MKFTPDKFLADGDDEVMLGHIEVTAKPTGKTPANKWGALLGTERR
jgi:hypothetical protein